MGDSVEREYAALWEAAAMVLEDNARRMSPEKIEVALVAVEED